MQPLTTGPRAHLTEDAVTRLLKTDSGMHVGGGLELLNRDLEVLADLTGDLQDGDVTRSSYATLHGSCSLNITTELAWGSAVLRPYMLINSDSQITPVRFNLGAYFTNTPDHVTGVSPTTYSVMGTDILDALNTPVGDSYALNAGTEYLTAIKIILENQGYSKFTIDPSRAGTTLPSAKGWPMADNVTWLTVVNNLLSAIGYRGVYSDWDGFLICESYRAPEDRSVEWTYDDGEFTSQLGPQQTIGHDYASTPNTWIGVRSNNIEGASPVEGDGIFTYQNLYDGETSVEARQRVIPRRYDFEVADQAALVAAVMRQATADKRVGTYITADSTANPLHWHFDLIEVVTQEIGQVRIQQSEWKLPLSSGMMSHSWAVI